MKNFPNYFVLRASKRGVWSATPFVNEGPAERYYEKDKASSNTNSVALLEIDLQPDREVRACYNIKQTFSRD